MILSESLHPGLSRGGFSHSQQIRLGKLTPDDFLQAESGIWLLPDSISADELDIATKKLGAHAINFAYSKNNFISEIANLLDNAELSDESACWLPQNQLSESEHTEALWTIAGFDMGIVLNMATLAVKQKIQLCDNDSCLNPRHYDYTHGVASRDRLLEPDERCYTTLPDGRISTIWGDILPSVADSITELRWLQQQCPPYADEISSPLTANGISKITIEPLTGCWQVRSYYTRILDGYGRLMPRRQIHKSYGGTASQGLAHRVVWYATGHKLKKDQELNHKCGYKPCANPLHMKVVGRDENIRHSLKMRAAVARYTN